MPPRVHVIGNREAPLAIAYFRQVGCEVINLHATTKAETITVVQRAIVEDGADRIVAIGGDGMIHAVVNAVANLGPQGASVTVAVIAIGTGNDFARAVGLPIDNQVEAAKLALLPGSLIDLLKTTHGWVASVATCGFPARVNARANKMRWPKGPSKYTLATVALIRTLMSDCITVTFDGKDPFVVDCSIIAIGNTAYFGGGMKICPTATPTDGEAEVVLVNAIGRFEMLRYLPTVFSGAHTKHPKTSMHQARTIMLSGSADIELWGDGEPLGPLPVTIEVCRNAIQLCLAGKP